jgi:hypothetical protein
MIEKPLLSGQRCARLPMEAHFKPLSRSHFRRSRNVV